MPSAATVVVVLRSGTDADATAWATAVVAAGGTVSATRLGQVSTLIKALKAAGVWTKIDRLWLLAAENNQAARVDLVARTLATVVNSPTFTVDRGYTGNGTSSYINSGFVPSVNGVASQLNSAHIGVYNRTLRTDSSLSVVDAGIFNATAYHIASRYAGQTYSGTNAAASLVTATAPNSSGFFISSRTASTATQSFRNGASLGTDATLATAVPAGAVFALGRNDASTPSLFTPDQFAVLTCGGGLSPAEALSYYNIIQAHMTSIGAQV